MADRILKNGKLFADIQRDIGNNYPNLLVLVEGGSIHIRGTLRLKDKKGVILDSYLIDVTIPDNFPQKIPELREIGNKIPHIQDRHFNPDGKACLGFRDEIFLYWNDKSGIMDFIKVFVEPFFIWQTEFEATGGDNKEKAYYHGTAAAFQFYGNLIGTKNQNAIYNFIDYLSRKKIKGHWRCFCGSGKQLRDCHFELVKKYKEKIRMKDARKTINELNEAIRKLVEKKKENQ